MVIGSLRVSCKCFPVIPLGWIPDVNKINWWWTCFTRGLSIANIWSLISFIMDGVVCNSCSSHVEARYWFDSLYLAIELKYQTYCRRKKNIEAGSITPKVEKKKPVRGATELYIYQPTHVSSWSAQFSSNTGRFEASLLLDGSMQSNMPHRSS